MRNSPQLFPWKLFRSLVLGQLSIFIPVLVLIGFFGHFAFKSWVGASSPEALVAFDQILFLILSFLFFTVFATSLWMGRKLILPLGRMLMKARTLGRKDLVAEQASGDPENFDEEEPGEWSDLEVALYRLGKDLSKKDERLFREVRQTETLIEAMSDAILAVDREGNPLFYNSQFALSFAMSFGRKDFDRNPLRLREIFRTPELLDAFDQSIKSAKRVHQHITLPVEEQAQMRTFSVSVAPLMGRDPEKVYGAVGIFHDITELKRAEQIRIDFVGNVSHELRTPLTSIKGYSDTLREDLKQGITDQMDQHLEVIARNVDRLMSLVDDLLDLSSIESGGGDLAKSVVETKELTERVLGQLEAKRKTKGHQIETQFQSRQIAADARRVEQVLTNLIENAIKYIPPQSRIDIDWLSASDHSTELHIKDNGPGISPWHLPRLFERFYRVDKARSRELGGTGLGLAIVKHIMQKHGGSVEVKSELGKGTEFICCFPKE